MQYFPQQALSGDATRFMSCSLDQQVKVPLSPPHAQSHPSRKQCREWPKQPIPLKFSDVMLRDRAQIYSVENFDVTHSFKYPSPVMGVGTASTPCLVCYSAIEPFGHVSPLHIGISADNSLLAAGMLDGVSRLLIYLHFSHFLVVVMVLMVVMVIVVVMVVMWQGPFRCGSESTKRPKSRYVP